jgi:hypothetical protein
MGSLPVNGTVVSQHVIFYIYTVKRPKFGNGPLVRHPQSNLLKNHISGMTVVSYLVQKGKRLYIFF